jgi:hypothetical protein
MGSGLIQALNMSGSSQREITPRLTYHTPTPFYFFPNIPVQLHYPEANTNGTAVATWDMNTACGAKAGQIEGQSPHTVEETHSHDKENDEPYVVCDGSGLSRQDTPTGPVRQQSTSRNHRQALQRVYDRPGHKPAVPYEADLPRLQALSRQRGGQDFAIDWIPKVFAKGATLDALRRTLSEDEINAVDHDHGFRLSQAYDGFLEKVEDRFECGLCAEEKRANWKNKKDAIRHFQKFHFGIGKICGTW